MNEFELDPRLASDSLFIADGPLSQLRMMDEARFAWLLLVPRVAGAVEWVDLPVDQQATLMSEISDAANLLRATSPCDKLNLGALGNVVRQFHVHLVARLHTDAAWPGPVWGAGDMQRLSSSAREERIACLRHKLREDFWTPPRG